MRSRNIEFVCQKLKPRTKFYAFFDGIALPKKLVTPKILGLIKDPAVTHKQITFHSKLERQFMLRKEMVSLDLRQE